MSEMETISIAALKEQEDKRHDALSATVALVEMDPHARKDLISYLKALNESQAAGDKEEQEYLAKAILEVFELSVPAEQIDLDAWEKEIKLTPEGTQASAR